MEIDKRIEEFISEHHVLTLATATLNGEPYCCNAFYAYDKKSGAFIFTTDSSTHHGKMMTENQNVAASILLETRTVGKIQGLQITGKVKAAKDGKKVVGVLSPGSVFHIGKLAAKQIEISHRRNTDGVKLTLTREGSCNGRGAFAGNQVLTSATAKEKGNPSFLLICHKLTSHGQFMMKKGSA